MNLTRTYKKNSYTEFLSRDSLDAVVEDHLDNSYNGDSAVANCRTDSTVFADYCAENGGDVTDYFMLEKCSVLHLSCVMKFTPKVAAGEYLQATAKRMKDRCIAEFYAPEEDPAEVDSTLPVDSTLLVDSRDGQTYRTGPSRSSRISPYLPASRNSWFRYSVVKQLYLEQSNVPDGMTFVSA